MTTVAVKPISLPELAGVLRRMYPGAASPPSYYELWQGAINGKYPARRVGRYWVVDADDLERIGAAFSLDS